MATVRPRPPRRRIRGRYKLWGNLSRGSERGIIEDSQILIDCSAGSLRRKSLIAFDALLAIGIGLMRLASTANPSPPTSRSLMQRRTTLSKTQRKRSLCRKRPCLFLENVE